MEYAQLSDTLSISRIVQGLWRVTDWNYSDMQLLKFVEEVLSLGIDSFDQADIYGNYESEKKFGEALKLKPSLREEIKIISKCGIKLLSDKFPERKAKHYDYSYEHIVKSAETSLKNMRTDRLDLLLLHRPSPFFNAEEVARAFEFLKKGGKVLHFGVSNFKPSQFEVLQSYLSDSLVTNQVEISPFCLEHFENGNIDFFQKHKIKPMAWSPLGGGNIFNTKDEGIISCLEVLNRIGEELNCSVDQVVYAWLVKHPVGICPVIGTGKIERVKSAAKSLEIDLNLEQWFQIYEAGLGEELP
ncbi:aldo/keto reductase [Namhaeicola litoreus]|uniref:Aldo/keto reductase family oxidoreductase n=1 Tax=Namhaeicola litoreus TaxID=1052145 RepID=A0ABW3XZS6_9FLAO